MNKCNEPYFNRRNFILSHLDDLNLTSEESILLLLLDFNNEFNFSNSLKDLSIKLKIDENKVDQLINRLIEKQYVEVKMDNRKVEYCLDNVFIINEDDKQVGIERYGDLFEIYEKAFGRPLSQNEAIGLRDLMSEYDFKLIEYALKEASVYEKVNMDYIKVILRTWKEKKLTPEMYENGER